MIAVAIVHVLRALSWRRSSRGSSTGPRRSSPAAGDSRCSRATPISASSCGRTRSTARPRPGSSARGRSSVSPARRGAPAACPSPACGALLAFPGDLLLFAYLLGLMRFFTVARGARHRLELRGDGGEPRSHLLGPGRAGAAARSRDAGPAGRAASRSRMAMHRCWLRFRPPRRGPAPAPRRRGLLRRLPGRERADPVRRSRTRTWS